MHINWKYSFYVHGLSWKLKKPVTPSSLSMAKALRLGYKRCLLNLPACNLGLSTCKPGYTLWLCIKRIALDRPRSETTNNRLLPTGIDKSSVRRTLKILPPRKD